MSTLRTCVPEYAPGAAVPDLRLRLSNAALTDFEAIWDYTAQHWGAAHADSYTEELERTFRTLQAMPGIARERPEFHPAVRIHPVARHLIVYRVEGDCLDIIRILGGRQDWRALLDPGE